MFPAVWRQLVPAERTSRPAFFTLLQPRLIFLDTYPVIVPDANSTGILGTLYSGLNANDLRRLDWF